MSFTRYPDYKESGVEWLPSIPWLWGFKRINVIASLNDDALLDTTDGEQEITYVDIGSVSLSAGVEKFEVFTLKDAPSRARRKVKDGDVIISTVRTYLKAIAPIVNPPENLVVSTGFAVLRAKSDMKSSFIKYALQSNGFLDEIISRSTGVSYPAINASEIGFIKIPVPSLPEQTQITNFLDQETNKIDALVAEQQKLIDLLKEKRLAVIFQAVTKGLDPKVKLKDSGLKWVGEIPEHWELSKGRKIFKIKKRIVGELGYEVLSITQKGIRIKDTESNEGQLSMDYSKYQLVEIGDFAMNHMDLLTGFVDLSPCVGVTSPDYRVFTVSDLDNYFPEYFLYLLQNGYSNKIFYPFGQGSSQLGRWRLPTEQFKEFGYPYPPIDEQKKISSYISKETRKIDALVNESTQVIKLLQERRSALISATVTGQVDVRNYQAREVA